MISVTRLRASSGLATTPSKTSFGKTPPTSAENDDGDVAVGALLANLSGRGLAADSGHAQIHQDHIERLAARELNRRFAVSRLRHLGAESPQDRADQVAIDQIVVDHQNATPLRN